MPILRMVWLPRITLHVKNINVLHFQPNLACKTTGQINSSFRPTYRWFAGLLRLCYRLTFIEALCYGSIVSATDPVRSSTMYISGFSLCTTAGVSDVSSQQILPLSGIF